MPVTTLPLPLNCHLGTFQRTRETHPTNNQQHKYFQKMGFSDILLGRPLLFPTARTRDDVFCRTLCAPDERKTGGRTATPKHCFPCVWPCLWSRQVFVSCSKRRSFRTSPLISIPDLYKLSKDWIKEEGEREKKKSERDQREMDGLSAQVKANYDTSFYCKECDVCRPRCCAVTKSGGKEGRLRYFWTCWTSTIAVALLSCSDGRRQKGGRRVDRTENPKWPSCAPAATPSPWLV